MGSPMPVPSGGGRPPPAAVQVETLLVSPVAPSSSRPLPPPPPLDAVPGALRPPPSSLLGGMFSVARPVVRDPRRSVQICVRGIAAPGPDAFHRLDFDPGALRDPPPPSRPPGGGSVGISVPKGVSGGSFASAAAAGSRGLSAVSAGGNAFLSPIPASFANLASDGFPNGGPVGIKAPSCVNGMPAIFLSDEELEMLARPLDLMLIGKFSFGRPKWVAIKKFFADLKMLGEFKISHLDSKHFVLQLRNYDDYTRVFSKGVYFIQNFHLKLLKWSINMDLSVEPSIVPVWITLPGVGFHMYTQPMLYSLLGIYGKPLWVDSYTASGSRPAMVKALVEMDVLIDHPKEVLVGNEVNGYKQKVIIDYIPKYCTFCRCHGHMEDGCFIKRPSSRRKKDVAVFGPILPTQDIESGKQVKGHDPVASTYDSQRHIAPLEVEELNTTTIAEGPPEQPWVTVVSGAKKRVLEALSRKHDEREETQNVGNSFSVLSGMEKVQVPPPDLDEGQSSARLAEDVVGVQEFPIEGEYPDEEDALIGMGLGWADDPTDVEIFKASKKQQKKTKKKEKLEALQRAAAEYKITRSATKGLKPKYPP